MSKFVVTCRYVYFTFLAALLLIQLGLSSSTVTHRHSSLQRQIAIYSVLVSVIGLLVTCVIMCVDVLRENALFSQVAVEVSWLGILFALEVADSAALTAVLPQLNCSSARICNRFGAVTGISWVITLAVVVYLLVLLTCAILHHEAYPHVWRTGVRDFPWFMNSRPGSRLPSRPNSPEKPKDMKIPKEPFYRKHSDLSAPHLVAPQPRYIANPILPDDYQPNAHSPGPIIQIAPKAHLASSPSPRLYTNAPLDFLNSDVDSRGRPTTREGSPRSTSRRPSRKRPPPLDLSQVTSHRG